MPLPLAGLQILDLTRVLAGPYATQMFGDLGADVWKIERPGDGDETRAWGPPFVAGTSAYYLSINRNKKSAALDFRNPQHLAALKRAAATADVVMENFVPGDLARYGLDAATLRKDRPELIVCSITGYGQDGPYASLPGYDAVLQGFTGLMSITGEPNGRPLKVGVAAIDVLTGVHTAASVLGALVGKLRHGVGCHIDIALFEVGVASMVNVSESTLVTGQPARRHGNAHPHIVPYQTFEASDGAMVVTVGNDEQWQRLCRVLEVPAISARADWATNAERVKQREELIGMVSARFAEGTREEWLAKLRAGRVPAGPLRDLHEVVRDPALAERGMVTSGKVAPSNESVPLMALPWKIDAQRPPLRLPPPALGQHTDEFLARFGA
jgi:crotonobetainyl-CoA:carnitine CoA-transferase CaiB-like acyl-CoA transferase